MRGAATTPIALAALLLGACGGAASNLGVPPRVEPELQVRGGDAALQARFDSQLSRWTRRAELYDRLDARVFFAATLLTPDFREALAARDAALGLTPLTALSAFPLSSKLMLE